MENNVAYYMADAGIQLDRAWQIISGTLNPELRRVCQPDTLSNDEKCTPQLRRIGDMVDTAGWVLYRQGKYAEAELYLRSAYAINASIVNETHLSAVLAKTGHSDEALQYFLKSCARPGFDHADSTDARVELAKVLGGEKALDARLKEVSGTPEAGATMKVLVLVDEHGKVLEARPADEQTPESLIPQAKSRTLPQIVLPDHLIRSIRTLEFRREGSAWVLDQSYVGKH